MSSFFDFSSLVNVKDLQQNNKSIHYETKVPKQIVTPNEPITFPEKKITKIVNNEEISASLFSFDAISSLFADMTFESPSQQEALENLVQQPKQQSIPVVPVATDDEFGEPIKELWNLRLRKPFKLFDYQLQLVKWVLFREKKENELHGIRGALVAAVMGSGKTLITLTLIFADILRRLSLNLKTPGPTLILGPKALLCNWRDEIHKFFGPHIRVLIYFKEMMKPKSSFYTITAEEYNSYQVILSTYDTIALQASELGMVRSKKPPRNNKDILQSTTSGPILLFSPCYRIVVDESHIFANLKSRMFLALKKMQSKRKLALSASVVRNYNADVYAQLSFLGFDTIKDSRKWSEQVFQDLQLKEVIYSLTLKDAKIDLPDLHDIDVECTLDETETKLYDKFTQFTNVLYQKVKKGSSGSGTFGQMLKAIIRWRQICVSIRLLPPEELQGLQVSTLSSKFRKLKELLENHIPPDTKVLIFSNWSRPLQLMLEFLPAGRAVVVDGKLNTKKRAELIERFKTDPTILYLLMTYKVGGVGLNLCAANRVILLEPWYCHVSKEQSMKRIHRIGQTNTCYVYNLLVKNSIESKIIEINQKKSNLAKRYLGSEDVHEDTQTHEGQMMDVLDAYFQSNKLT